MLYAFVYRFCQGDDMAICDDDCEGDNGGHGSDGNSHGYEIALEIYLKRL